MALLTRIGHGLDIHRLQPGGRLILCGVVVSSEISAIAHSDGDIALHAVVDALLGAIGAGDIGEHFPNTKLEWHNAPSSRFVEHAVKLVHDAGYEIANLDLLIQAERPKLKAFKPQMRSALAAMLGVELSQVNVKAGTNEGCDAVGQGEAIAADAVVLLQIRA